jgi:hypothetical protein
MKTKESATNLHSFHPQGLKNNLSNFLKATNSKEHLTMEFGKSKSRPSSKRNDYGILSIYIKGHV